MSLQEKLARYVAEKPGLAVALEGPLTAARLVDLHAQARLAGAPMTVLHEGAPTEVARKMAARFGIALVDAGLISDVAAPVNALSTPEQGALAIPAPPRAVVAEPLLAPIEAPLLLAPHIEVPLALAAPEPVAVREPPAPIAAPEPLCVGLPWDPSSASNSPEITIEVSAAEIAALPWHAHAPIEEHTEIMESPVTRRRAPLAHPTSDLHPHSASWGLPWPRPVPNLDAVSKSDPAIWNMPQRMQAMRDDIESKMAPPAKLDGAWLKRLQG